MEKKLNLEVDEPYYIRNIYYGYYLFVSEDRKGNPPDQIVEGKAGREIRSVFILKPSPIDGEYCLYNKHYGNFLFVSGDVLNGDNVIEAHSALETRNYFSLHPAPGSKFYYRIFNESLYKWVFLSENFSGVDRILEAHDMENDRDIYEFILTR